MPVLLKFIIAAALIVLSAGAGYLARRYRLASEQLSRPLMTFVIVFGYSSVSLLAVWRLRPVAADAWLPVLGVVHVVVMIAMGLLIGRWVARERRERGLFGIASAMGNTGFTMGGFVLYVLHGEQGLALASILGLMWYPMVVLAVYPIARHYSSAPAGGSLVRLMLRSIFDWRSIGLLAVLVGLALALLQVPRPDAIAEYNLVDIMMFVVIAAAYFSIGLRLRAEFLWAARKLIISLAGMRFVLGAAVGLALAFMTYLTAWPLRGVSFDVLVIESFVPMGVTVVAVANMFGLRPRIASAMFVANTGLYLAVVLPVVLWIFSHL